MSERTSGAPYFRLFAGFARDGLSPLYERLALAIAEDPQMLAFAAKARRGQPQANILFGAVHALLMGGADHPLKDYYPSCGGKRRAEDGDVYPTFVDFVDRYRSILEPSIASRVTNTNEVGRSALIYPAFDLIGQETKPPLQIIEIGPSAGLNLNWHRYGYRYTDEADAALARGDTGSLVLETRLVGAGRPPLALHMPEVKASLGLEQSPVDLGRAEERLWLRALIWPERLDRLARLNAALDVATQHPPAIIEGDAIRDLESCIARIEAGTPIVLVHTLVTYQFDQAAHVGFESVLQQVARARPIYRVSVEWDGSCYPVILSRYEGATRSDRTLGRCDPHGGWLEWLV